MSLLKMDQLYKQLVLEHAQKPHNYGVLPTKTSQYYLKNPTCGDVIEIQVNVKANVIVDISFVGNGCTISQASASMLTDNVKGLEVTDAKKNIKNFLAKISGQTINEIDNQNLQDAAILGSIAQFPTRIKCATLAWHALAEILKKEGAK